MEVYLFLANFFSEIRFFSELREALTPNRRKLAVLALQGEIFVHPCHGIVHRDAISFFPINPLRAPKPLSISRPSNFVPRKGFQL